MSQASVPAELWVDDTEDDGKGGGDHNEDAYVYDEDEGDYMGNVYNDNNYNEDGCKEKNDSETQVLEIS